MVRKGTHYFVKCSCFSYKNTPLMFFSYQNGYPMAKW